MRRLAIACAVFAVGVVVGTAVMRPAHDSSQEQSAVRLVEAASGGKEVSVACAPDHCGVVVRRPGAARCDGWIVPVGRQGRLGRPQRAAFADC